MKIESIAVAEKLMGVLEDVDLLTADSAIKLASVLINERAAFKVQTDWNRELSVSTD
jgi:hypothetical protein